MTFLNSIRWRLQIWYGLVLVGVLAGFGFTAYQLERGRQFRRIDDELQRRAIAVANALRPPAMRGQFPGERNPGEPMPQRPPLRERRPLDPRSADDEDPPERLLPLDEIRLRLERTGLFDESGTNSTYYVVWSREGRELVRSANAPMKTIMPSFPAPRGPQPPQMRGPMREMFHARPSGEIILAGRSIASERAELRLTALKLAGMGGVILLLGLAGGWWIASRAMRPIESISGTAVKIAAGDLSQRISTSDAESELGQLAGVLNSTFSRLETSFAQQRQFTADAAHELRTPVSVILTETQTTLKRERTAEEYRQSVEVCQRITQRMRRLIESLFQLARLDAGQEQLKRMQFDLAKTARDCVELIRPLADERGVRILCDLPSLECSGDAERIAQVVTNLLANAIQYNRPDGEVRLSARQEGGVVMLTVRDTGPGISTEDLPRVFERFYRAEKSRSSGNAGLGLSICKAIVEAHGGTIEVVSRPDEGSTFTMQLPAGNPVSTKASAA